LHVEISLAVFGNDLGEAWMSVVRSGHIVDVIRVTLDVYIGCVGRLMSMSQPASRIAVLLRAAVLISASVLVVIPSGNIVTIW
jgi:hypothetical protein